jgi:hypothetical protein
MLTDEKIRNLIRFEPLSLDTERSGMYAGWLRLPKLPLDRDLRHLLIETLAFIREATEKSTRKKIIQDIYLQMTQLERPSGTQLISRNGSRWKPLFGMGVWPDREPPQPLNENDFKNLSPGQSPRETSYQIMHICASEEPIREEIITQMAGTGALLIALVGEEWGPMQQDAISQRLEASMTADAFIGYPVYFPLLDANSIRNLNKDDFDAFLPDVAVYLREDLAENALLFLSRISLYETFFTPAESKD